MMKNMKWLDREDANQCNWVAGFIFKQWRTNQSFIQVNDKTSIEYIDLHIENLNNNSDQDLVSTSIRKMRSAWSSHKSKSKSNKVQVTVTIPSEAKNELSKLTKQLGHKNNSKTIELLINGQYSEYSLELNKKKQEKKVKTLQLHKSRFDETEQKKKSSSLYIRLSEYEKLQSQLTDSNQQIESLERSLEEASTKLESKEKSIDTHLSKLSNFVDKLDIVLEKLPNMGSEQAITTIPPASALLPK
jgi:DNA repair exonuclease SbcCD ATPase subunit